ncbi:hypothetical protein RFI_01440 [Reticulomyxa filosa]|uniref:Inosine/uridine-preferring nucleoside hydrolase domain-containing protein n=1 Tax=Reticulomyxa filosa TaxID=46433 RepID=X6PBR1_RETFI|nr:hypothetical protein RFI_01440 [Reticulomyxa filosa]|eukprot:ETO35621.1 hypothetical protein RFI_01440 [Reticulomyxa filosa]
MGGCIYARGNACPMSEWNFFYDPEAVKIVLQHCHQTKCVIFPYDCFSDISFSRFYEQFQKFKLSFHKNSRLQTNYHFIHKLFHYWIQMYQSSSLEDRSGFYFNLVDFECLLCYLYQHDVITKSRHVKCDVELAGEYSRGALAIDWLPHPPSANNVHIIESVNGQLIFQKFFELLESIQFNHNFSIKLN